MRVLILRYLALVFMIAGGGLAGATPAQATVTPTQFMQTLGDHVLKIVADQSISADARRAALASAFYDDFDVPYIGRFVLGRYWRVATDQQKADYLKVFGQYVVAIYADRFTNYGNVKFTATGQNVIDQNTTAVETTVDRGGGAPLINIEWRIENTPTGYKIIDVVAENLSLSVTKRDEFGSVIENGGGNVQTLIDLLKSKVAGD
jgi:phospholipid transport system substrate-binding protein